MAARGGGRALKTGRLIGLGGVLAVAAAVAAGCGDDRADAEREVVEWIDRPQAEQRAKVVRAVRDGRLPRVTLEMFDVVDGTVNPSFIDGPNFDEDVVRTRDGGARGPKLRWDLDQDGRLEPEEREITERELYDATLRLTSGAAPSR